MYNTLNAVLYSFDVLNVVDNGPPAAAGDEVPSSTASVDGDKQTPAASTPTPAVPTAVEDSNNNSTAGDADGDNTSSGAPVATNQQSQITVIPELPDATSNAFTQLVL